MNLVDNIMAMQEEEFEYKGKMYTYGTFAQMHRIAPDAVIGVVAVLEQQGKIKRSQSEEDPILDKDIRHALKELEAFSAAQQIEQDVMNEQLYKKMVVRDGRHVYPKVEFAFGNMQSLKEFRGAVKEMYLDSEMVIDDDERIFTLRVKDVSDKELTALSNLYKANKFVKATVEFTSKGFDTAFKVTDYAAKKVAVPVAKIGITGSLSIAKSLVGSLAKVGGLAVSETIKAVRETSEALAEDEQIAIAKAELLRSKNEIVSSIGHKSYDTGIKIG